MILTDDFPQLNLKSKSFKAIKHIVFHWQGRELLRYPYPLFITARMVFFEEEQLAEVMHSYRGKLLSIYFTPDLIYYPLHLKIRFPKCEFILEELQEEKNDEEEESLGELFLKPVKKYFLYFQLLAHGLWLSLYSPTTYKSYCEMFDQSQKIVQNMGLDRENLFEGLEDIKLDISESPYKEDLRRGKKSDTQSAECFGNFGTNGFGTVESFYQNCSYRYDLEEAKRVLLAHLGEHNLNGYCGLNENTFKLYSSRLQLAILFNIHRHYVCSLSSADVEGLEKVSLWKHPFSFRGLPFLAVESFYVRRFYRKFNLFNKT